MSTAKKRPPVAVYGCGTIGASWAALFAAHGDQIGEVRLYDITPEATAAGLAKARRMLGALPTLRGAAKKAALKRLRAVATPAELLDGVEFIQESVLERYPIKAATHAVIEQFASKTAIVSTSSSGLLASQMSKAFKHPERFLVGHPFNPPHLVPLVELVPGPRTSKAVLKKTNAFFTALGKVPVLVRKEVPGHIANRLAAAVWREALDLVDRGVASVEDVDKALYAGPGLRWAILGQHQIYNLNGGPKGYAGFFDQFESQFALWWDDMATWKKIPARAKKTALKQMAEFMRGKSVADLEAHRDKRLNQLLAVLYGNA